MTESLAKKNIEDMEPIARELMKIADTLGENDIISMYVSKSHTYMFTTADNKKKFTGLLWNNPEVKERGVFDFSEEDYAGGDNE